MKIFIEDSFDAAHWLPNVPEEHKCRRMHGHTYRVRIEVSGPVDSVSGWVIDYAEIRLVWLGFKQMLDHRVLNDIPSLANSTSENIAAWIFRGMSLSFPGVSCVELRETEHCGAIAERA